MWICVLNSRLSIISFYNLNGFLKKEITEIYVASLDRSTVWTGSN